jgi:NADH-quinone oxidoreductase subunit K
MPVPFHWYLILSGLLFAVGAAGVLTTRNVIVLLMGVEVMLNGANLALVAAARHWGLADGLVYVFIVMTVAAAEAAVGLALVIAVYRKTRSLNVDDLNLLKG